MLKLEKIRYIYEDGGFILQDIDLRIATGDFFALVGGNGSGKTTLLKIIIGLLRPASGTVYLEGEDISRKKERETITRISMVFQDPNDQIFLPFVNQDVSFGPLNLGLSAKEAERAAREALRMVGLEHKWNAHIANLSYGEKKRVALAGVLAMRPRLILLDEPTSGLDPLGTHDFMQTLTRLREEKALTVVMATHDLDLVPLYCNRMAILREGLLVKCGIISEVFQDLIAIRGSNLRLPRVGHLMEILRGKDNVPLSRLPLTISGAREAILRWAGERS
jgi:cobalt/nickel transport system ATP-binding protein